MKSQTRNSSYKNLFSILKESEDFFEVQLLQRIKDDYDKFHQHSILDFENLLKNKENLKCPDCNSSKIISHGYDKNKTKRYKCKECNKTFNRATSSLFSSSKINIKAWFHFLECLLSGTSTLAACISAKISPNTGVEWLKKIFLVLKDYQSSIKLDEIFYIDETYVHEDKSKIFYFDEIGKIKKVKKEPRGISRNKICILIATDAKQSFAEIIGHGRPQRIKNYDICLKHLKPNSTMIGDEDTSLTYTANEMNLNRIMIKSNTEEAYEKLKPIDDLCNRFKFFINKHRGFHKEILQDYINLFMFIDNEKNINDDLYLVTKKLLKLLFSYKKVE